MNNKVISLTTTPTDNFGGGGVDFQSLVDLYSKNQPTTLSESQSNQLIESIKQAAIDNPSQVDRSILFQEIGSLTQSLFGDRLYDEGCFYLSMANRLKDDALISSDFIKYVVIEAMTDFACVSDYSKSDECYHIANSSSKKQNSYSPDNIDHTMGILLSSRCGYFYGIKAYSQAKYFAEKAIEVCGWDASLNAFEIAYNCSKELKYSNAEQVDLQNRMVYANNISLKRDELNSSSG